MFGANFGLYHRYKKEIPDLLYHCGASIEVLGFLHRAFFDKVSWSLNINISYILPNLVSILWQQMDGTVEELMSVLMELKRQDAVQVLQQCAQIKPG